MKAAIFIRMRLDTDGVIPQTPEAVPGRTPVTRTPLSPAGKLSETLLKSPCLSGYFSEREHVAKPPSAESSAPESTGASAVNFSHRTYSCLAVAPIVRSSGTELTEFG